LEAPKYKCEAPIIGVCGRSPQRGPGVEPLVRGSGGEALPPKAETLLAFGRLLKVANLKRKKSDTICVVFSKNDVYRPQYVTDYCTAMKSNRLVDFG